MARTRSVLIIGGSSAVGTHLALAMRENFKVFATYHKHPIKIPGVTSLPLAADDREWAKRVVYLAKPDAVIFAAGSNSVAAAEADPRIAEHVHVGGPATVADVADILQPKFIYLSNCFVFDGSKGNYHEEDTALPFINIGKSKMGGENFVRGRSMNYFIIRSSPLIGRGNGFRNSFFDQVRMALQKGERIELQNNDTHSFGLMSSLTELIIRAVESGVKNKLVHYGGLTKLTHYEWAVQFAKRFGFDPSLVVAARGGSVRKDYSLNSSEAVQLLKLKPLLLEESFNLIEQKLIP